MHIDVRTLTGLDTLAGKSGGLRDFPKFIAALEEAPDGTVISFGWDRVELATASYFGATVVPLLRMIIGGELDRYIVLTGLNRTCMDELKLVLELQNLVVLVVPGKTSRKIEALGGLDPAYRQTLEAVQRRKSASATNLYASDSGATIGKTAWINRLTNLHRLRLLKKQKVGREFVYEAVTMET
jgi:hypothetical protein